MSLKKKVVIVTGASSGIGAKLTIEALKQGAKVTAVGRNKEKLVKLLKDCKEIAGKRPLIVVADVTKEDQAERIIKETIKEHKKIDILINNAGFGRAIEITDGSAMETFDSVMDTNIRAVVHLTHLAIPYLEKTKGNIVNISSVAALKASQGLWAYCTAKAALDHFTRCMAVDLAPKGIRVNVINPGPVETDFAENMGLNKEQVQGLVSQVKGMTMLDRYSQAIEIVDLILLLVSEKAIGITGASHTIDNGVMLK